MEIGAFYDTLPHGQVLLRTKSLKKAFGGQVVLDGLDLELREGEVVLLRGENGSGKTTLLNILTGNLEPDAGAIHYLTDNRPRSYRFPRPWWQELNPFDHFTPEFVAREGVGRTWQEIRLFGAHTLRDNIAVAAPGHPGENPVLALFTSGRSARRETGLNHAADAMLARLGLAERQDSSADKISLGQTKRVAIARTVAAGARILFLDEPLAGLDRQGIGDVLELLESLVREHGVTLVIVEHLFNQPHLHGLVTTDWLLEGGAIRRTDRNGRESDSVRPRSLGPSETSIQRPAWFGLLAGEGTEILDEPLPRGALLTRVRRPGVFKNPPEPVLEIRDLVVKQGARVVIGLDDQGDQVGFSLALYEGEIAVLQAPNGWGKTSLLFGLAGLAGTQSGGVRIAGTELTGTHVWYRTCKGMRLLHSGGTTFPSLRAGEVIELARRPVEADDVSAFKQRRCGSLSGGEKQRLALAIEISAGSPVAALLLDEPFVALDESNVIRHLQSLLMRRDRCILITIPSPLEHLEK